jgi:hypothetical protein
VRSKISIPRSGSPRSRCGAAASHASQGEASDDEHRRALLATDRLAADFRIRDEDERPLGRVDLLAVEGEERVALRDEVELLVAAGAGPELVVLLDHVPPV